MTSASTSHSDCSWTQCSGEVNGPSRPSPVLRRSTEKRPSQLRPRRGPPSRSYCNSSRRLEACGSGSRLDVPLHPQPVTKLHPDKSRKHLPLQKTLQRGLGGVVVIDAAIGVHGRGSRLGHHFTVAATLDKSL